MLNAWRCNLFSDIEVMPRVVFLDAGGVVFR